MSRKGLGTIVLALLVVVSLWYVQAPPRGADDYRERAAKTAESLRSQVQTARLWSTAVRDERVTRQAATVTFREVEHGARSSASEFAGWDPPPGVGDIRSHLETLATDTTSALARLRIAAHRGDWDAIPALSEPLDELATRLERFEETPRP